MKIRCGIDGRELSKSRVTGIGRFLLNFLKTAVKIEDKWEFIIFGNQNTYFRPEFTNLRVIIIPEKSTFFWDQITLPRFLRKERIDIFFSPYYKAPVFSPCPVIITIHDITPFIKFEDPGCSFKNMPRGQRRLLKLWSSLLAKRAEKIITVSRHSKKDIMNFFKIPEEKIEVVHECAGEEFKPKEKDEIEKAERRYGIRGKYILYTGNLNPYKNIDGLIKAYSRLPSRLRDECFLVICGEDKKNSPRIKKLSKELGRIGENIVFPGFIDDSDLPSIYSGAELFVFPSFYEGFGLPPLEAMACGTPVISSNAASLPEVIGDAGILIGPRDTAGLSGAIERLLSDSGLRGEMKEMGLKRAALFNARDTAEKMLNLFGDILE